MAGSFRPPSDDESWRGDAHTIWGNDHGWQGDPWEYKGGQWDDDGNTSLDDADPDGWMKT